MIANQNLSIQAADILVVDDTIASLRMLTDILTKAGYKAHPVEDPQLALEAALAQPPSLILLDVRMPKMSGFEVCRRLKENAHTREVPIIFVSALDDAEVRVQGFEVGGVDFISKPLQEAEVLARVKTHLQLRYTQLHLDTLVAERTAEIVESEARYRNLIDNSVVGIFISTPDGRILFVNNALVQMYDFDSPEQMMAQGALERWHDVKDRDRFSNELQQHGSVTNFEAESVSRTGRRIYVIISVDQLGENFYGMVTDITERKQAEQTLRESEDKFRQVFQTGPTSFSITRLRDGLYIDVNDVWLERKGFRREDVIGKTVVDLGIWPNIEDRAEFVDRLTRDGSVRNMEIDGRLADGSIHRVLQSCSLIIVNGEPCIATAGMDFLALINEQEAHRLSEERFRVTFEQAAVGIAHVALDGRFLRLNQKLCDIVGYSRAEMEARTFQDITHPDDLDTDLENVRQLLAGEADTYSMEKRYIRKDRDIVWINLTVSLLRDTDEEQGWFVAVIEDITDRKQVDEELSMHRDHLETLVEERTTQLQEEIAERKKIEAELQTQINLFKSLLDATPDTIEIFNPDNLAYIKWNKACTEVTGYSDEEFATMNPATNFFDEADARRVEDTIDQVIREGEAIVTADLISKDGRRIPMEFLGSLARDAEGDPLYLISIGRDITDRKRAQEALLASEERYRDLVEKISDVIYSADMEGRITYLNPAIEALVGLTPEELVGQPLAQFLHQEDLERLQKNVQALLSGQPSGSGEYRVLPTSGETRWVHVTSQPIKDGDQIIGMQGVVRDITERKQAEARREQEVATAERDRLARRLHDAVTQTLFSASIIAQSIPRVMEKNPDLAERNLEQLSIMLRGALAEMRTMLIELRPAALAGKSLNELLQTLVEANQIRLNCPIELVSEGEGSLPENIAIVFYRIAQEAINNIIKYAEAQEVQINLCQDETGVWLIVKDNGLGFEPGQVPSGHFGLSIMQERIDQIGGGLAIDSQPGQGTQIQASWVVQLDE